MAISHPHYNALKELHRLGELPQGGSILEIGEANFYGDMPLGEIANDIKLIHEKYGQQSPLAYQLQLACGPPADLFAVAKVIYGLFLNPRSVDSIDLHGSPDAKPLDLNHPIHDLPQYTVTYNHGTAEHIFNIANVFRLMHDRTAKDGLMIHESPFTGWIDHGFYNLNPTLFYDLAAANRYDIRYLALEQLGNPDPLRIHSREQILDAAREGMLPVNTMLFVVFRKVRDDAFRMPMQGYYDSAISEEARRSWQELR
jgi:hypothetical protein